jgi:hypothetical protein
MAKMQCKIGIWLEVCYGISTRPWQNVAMKRSQLLFHVYTHFRLERVAVTTPASESE